MKKIICACFILFIGLSSFTAHKFYISISQVQFVPEKKMIQITTRIFIDDLNKALEKRFDKKMHIGDPAETPQEIDLMNQYLAEHFKIKVNGIKKPFLFLSKDLENNVLIGFYKVTEVSKIKSLEIQNNALMDVFSEQQNIIQVNFNNKKQSLLLTPENQSGVLK